MSSGKITCDLKTVSYHSSSSDGGASLPSAINLQTVVVSIVNPQGTVTTVTNNPTQLVESFSSDNYIHENCDETMFRPVVTVISDPNQQSLHDDVMHFEDVSQPLEMTSQLIVPVIDERMLEQKKKEREFEQQQQLLKQKEAQRAKEEEVMRREMKRVKEEEEFRRKEMENARKKAEEKPDETAVATGYQKKNRKAQKFNKKPEPERKTLFDKKEKSPVMSSPIEDKIHLKADDINKKLSEALKKIEINEEIVEEVKPPIAVIVDELVIEPTPIAHVEAALKIEVFKALETPIIEVTEVKEPSPEPVAPIIAPRPVLRESLPAPPIQAEMKPVRVFEKVDIVKLEPVAKKGKKGKKYPSLKSQEKTSPKVEEFPALEELPPLDPLPIDDYRAMDSDAIMKISKHETIGDDEIEIIPHNNAMIIQDSPDKASPDVEIIEEHFLMQNDPLEAVESKFIKSEDFYDVDDDLPPLEPLESFDANFEPLCFDEASSEKVQTTTESDQKQEMKKKMSELLKDTNMIFAMCSSLKEIKDDDDEKSMNSSQIQRSTSSSLTTNTTTATFASASSNQTGEGMDSDYKSLELDLDEGAAAEPAADIDFKVPLDVKQIEEPEDVSSFEATSSETDDSSSKRSNLTMPKFKRDDDEELRPLLQTSITSLSSPSTATANNTTDANDTSTLPDINQKSSSQATSNNGSGNKRKNKKKRR